MNTVFRVVRRTVVESLYLLTAPVTAAVGLLAVLGGLCVGAVGLLLPGGSPVVAGGLAPVRWFADVERWRITKVGLPADGVEDAGRWPRPKETAAASDPGLWLGVAHAVVVLPVALATSVVTALWWFVGLAGGTAALRNPYTSGSLRPMTLNAGNSQSHIALSLGLTSPAERLTFGTVVGLPCCSPCRW